MSQHDHDCICRRVVTGRRGTLLDNHVAAVVDHLGAVFGAAGFDCPRPGCNALPVVY